jgi:20S proteasome subunit alpha 6
MAIGARSQSARTYLEKCLEEYEGASLDGLIMHALKALRDTLPADSPTGLNLENCSLAVVGVDTPFVILDGSERLKALLDQLPAAAPRQMEVVEEAAAAAEAAPAPAAAEDDNQMDI